MEFDDLIGRTFVVKKAEASAKHAKDDIVTFHGSAENVEIQCKRYADGMYKNENENHTISGGTGEDAYTITVSVIDGDYRKIELRPGSQEDSGGVGGSWTADDMPPGHDNG
jgi:hypothetical protein